MLRTAPQSSRDWLHVVLVGAAGFLFFSAGLMALAWATNQPQSTSVATVGTRLIVSIIVATAMFVVERRRQTPSVDAAMVDGLQVAAVVIVAGNLTGTTDAGLLLALRSALLLIGLPVLEVLTHVFARGVGGARRLVP